jgi:hypothetical protein
MARFKDTQAFILGQLAFNPFHKFSQSAKEILLFKFDVSFDFLCEIEQYVLIKQENLNFEDIWEMYEMRVRYAREVLYESENVDSVYFKTYNDLIDVLRGFQKEAVMELFSTDLSPASLFGAIVDLLIKALNHILYVVQELDIIMYTNDTPVINFDVLSCELKAPISGKELCPALHRLNVYRNMRPFDEIIIKDYIELDIPFNKTKFYEKLMEAEIKFKII